MTRILAAALGLALAFAVATGPAAAQTYEEGLVEFDRTNYAGAMQIWLPLGQAGDPRAQHGLGMLFESGAPGVPRDEAAAVHWYELATRQGSAPAYNNLGLMYADGRGVPQNIPYAVDLWRVAAEAGHPIAQYNLALVYYRGAEGVGQDIEESAWWFAQAAINGSADAQVALAEMNRNGEGMPKNLREAERWYKLAIESGHPGAKQRLLTLYQESGTKPTAPLPEPADMTPATGATVSGAPALGAAAPAAEPSADPNAGAAPQPFQPSAEALAAAGTSPSPQPVENQSAALPAATISEQVPAGTKIWVGSARSLDEAAALWQGMAGRLPDLLAGLGPSAQKVDFGGDIGVWYRVLGAPFADQASAEAVCAAIAQRSPADSCMVVE